MKRDALLILILTALLLPACKQSDKEQFRQTADTIGQGIKNGIDTVAAKTKAGIDSLRSNIAHSDDVAVVIKDDVLQVQSMHPGHAELKVKNEGSMPHNLSVVGNGLNQSFAVPIPPGETQTLPIDIKEGTYQFVADAPNGKTAPRIMVTVK